MINEPIPDYGDVMTVEDFEAAVKSVCFTDDDGHGYYSDGKTMTKVYVDCAHIYRNGVQPGYTHVVWFNK